MSLFQTIALFRSWCLNPGYTKWQMALNLRGKSLSFEEKPSNLRLFRCPIGSSWMETISTCPQSRLHGKIIFPVSPFPPITIAWQGNAIGAECFASNPWACQCPNTSKIWLQLLPAVGIPCEARLLPPNLFLHALCALYKQTKNPPIHSSFENIWGIPDWNNKQVVTSCT